MTTARKIKRTATKTANGIAWKTVAEIIYNTVYDAEKDLDIIVDIDTKCPVCSGLYITAKEGNEIYRLDDIVAFAIGLQLHCYLTTKDGKPAIRIG